MSTAMDSILWAGRESKQKLNILTFPTHERYQSHLSHADHNYYLVYLKDYGFKPWNNTYAKLPKNHYLSTSVPEWVDFDIVLSQNKFGQFDFAYQFAKERHIPLISIEHTLPPSFWSGEQLNRCARQRGDLNVFISEYSISQWGFDGDPSVRVVHHGIDTDLFSPRNLERNNTALSVVNDWINRDYFCGYSVWKRVTENIPVTVLGDTPTLSRPAKDINELVTAYNECGIFINTSQVSPIPTSLLEAMSCGTPCVSTATCMIPEIITNGVDGFISNDEQELKQYIHLLLSDRKLAEQIGDNARQTILQRFGLDKFVDSWSQIFYEATEMLSRR